MKKEDMAKVRSKAMGGNQDETVTGGDQNAESKQKMEGKNHKVNTNHEDRKALRKQLRKVILKMKQIFRKISINFETMKEKMKR